MTQIAEKWRRVHFYLLLILLTPRLDFLVHIKAGTLVRFSFAGSDIIQLDRIICITENVLKIWLFGKILHIS